MARKPRIEFAGAVYHLISRGDRGRRSISVSRRWISENLGMGDLSRVTNAVRKVDSRKESEIRRWKVQLERNS